MGRCGESSAETFLGSRNNSSYASQLTMLCCPDANFARISSEWAFWIATLWRIRQWKQFWTANQQLFEQQMCCQVFMILFKTVIAWLFDSWLLWAPRICTTACGLVSKALVEHPEAPVIVSSILIIKNVSKKPIRAAGGEWKMNAIFSSMANFLVGR